MSERENIEIGFWEIITTLQIVGDHLEHNYQTEKIFKDIKKKLGPTYDEMIELRDFSLKKSMKLFEVALQYVPEDKLKDIREDIIKEWLEIVESPSCYNLDDWRYKPTNSEGRFFEKKSLVVKTRFY